MNQCCNAWVQSLSPRTKGKGRFTEIRTCPTCKTQFRVTFEEVSLLGDDGNSQYAVVGADPI
jgi:hypothetical protein